MNLPGFSIRTSSALAVERLEERVARLEAERAQREVEVTDLVDRLTALLKRSRMRQVRAEAKDSDYISPLTGLPVDQITFEIHSRRAQALGGPRGVQSQEDV